VSAHRNPQTAPAVALAQLTHENPNLPGLMWTIHPDGYLSGARHENNIDVRPVLAAYQQVLGGAISETQYVREGTGEERYAASLAVTWRDVPFYLSTGCPARLVLAQVAGVAA
jgi:hypothetical protein